MGLPFTLVQRMAVGIGCKHPQAVRPVEHEMPCCAGDNASSTLLEILGEGLRGWKGQVAGSLQGERDRIGGHLLAELAAPQDDKLEAGQFFKTHRTTRMDP